ncbi:MAG: hypothetical protein HY997_18845 [Mycolicibacterium neoaurum]|nr:hypothetical protein [Mycolicibacterium neoaurum]
MRDLAGRPLREYWEFEGAWMWLNDYVWRDGLLLATIDATGVRHAHLDHLGSARRFTDSQGTVVVSRDYLPFGQLLDSTGTSERIGFTSHERDFRSSLSGSTDDLDYMHARYYNLNLGRFLSPDPVRGDARSPQSFNLFGYVKNSPVTLIDPLGLSVARPEIDPTRPDGRCRYSRPQDPDCGTKKRKEPKPPINPGIIRYLQAEYGPVVIGNVINKTGKKMYYRPENKATALEVPPSGFFGAQEGITHPDVPGKVYKTTNLIDVTTLPGGEVEWEVAPGLPNWLVPILGGYHVLNGGWKDREWLETDRHPRGDTGWDELFDASR